MTVATTTNSYTYNGNGSTTVFAFNSVFLDAADLTVILTSSTGVETVQTITTHYTVSGGSGSTGSVTMVTPPASGEKLTIVRDPALTQTLDLVANDPLPAEELEQALDKGAMILQRLAERIVRSVVIQDSDTGTLTLPVAADRASKYAAFDASGNITAASGPTGDSSVPVSAFVETLLDDANASAFLDTLGAGAQGKSLFAAATAAAALALVTPLTTRGDIMVRGASASTRLALGSSGQIPESDGTDLAYVNHPLRRQFTSSQQTITSAGQLTIAHGLGAVPALVAGELVCTDAGGDANYVQGDIVQIYLGVGSAPDNTGCGVVKDATNLTVRFGGATNVFQLPDKTTGSDTALTNSKWALVLRAWL